MVGISQLPPPAGIEKPEAATAATVTWDSGTSVGATLQFSCGAYPALAVHVIKVGAAGGGTLVFEVSLDGTNWFAILGIRDAQSALDLGWTVSIGSMAWRLGVGGYAFFRVRLTGAVTGAGTADIRIQGTAVAQAPIVGAINNNGLNLGVNVIGNVSHDAVDSGGPIKIGGMASSTTPTPAAAGDRVNSWHTLSGAQVVSPDVVAAAADGMANPTIAQILNDNLLFNGTTWDRQRNDIELVNRASSALSPGSESGPDVTAYNHESLFIMLSVTNVAAGGLMTVSLQAKHVDVSAYFTYWTAELPIRTAGNYGYFFGNGASGGDFTECQAFGLPPRVFRLQYSVTVAAVTFSTSLVLGDN